MATRQLDRKARTGVIVAVALLFVGPLYLAAKLVIGRLVGEEKVVYPENVDLVMLQDAYC